MNKKIRANFFLIAEASVQDGVFFDFQETYRIRGFFLFYEDFRPLHRKFPNDIIKSNLF